MRRLFRRWLAHGLRLSWQRVLIFVSSVSLAGMCFFLNASVHKPCEKSFDEKEADEASFTELQTKPQRMRQKVTISYSHTQRLRGLMLRPSTPIGNASGEVEHTVRWSLVTTFSPTVESHVERMLGDRFGECQVHAMGPAISWWNGSYVANIRVWLAQYLLHKLERANRPVESWPENYIYSVRLDSNYEPLSNGGLLPIPTTTNAYALYRKDGPMDPRSFVYQGRLYVIFYSYALESRGTRPSARMYLWDYERNVKVRLAVKGLTLQGSSDINWAPLVTRRGLYLVYSLDPLRVLRCQPSRGRCSAVYQQSTAAEHGFSAASDHLRGGTPFVEHRHPYYYSLAHSAVSTADWWTAYRTHLVVLCADPWRLVYVSDHVAARADWLRSVPLVIDTYIRGPFWYPTSLIVRRSSVDDRGGDGDDFVDVGCHLNDHSSYVARLAGVRALLESVERSDIELDGGGGDGGGGGGRRRRSARVRAAQQYVLDGCKRAYGDEPSIKFVGDVTTDNGTQAHR